MPRTAVSPRCPHHPAATHCTAVQARDQVLALGRVRGVRDALGDVENFLSAPPGLVVDDGLPLPTGAALRAWLIGSASCGMTANQRTLALLPQRQTDQTGVRSPWRALHGDELPALPHHHKARPSPRGTRRKDTKHQQCRATITQILPPTLPQPHGCAHSTPASFAPPHTRNHTHATAEPETPVTPHAT